MYSNEKILPAKKMASYLVERFHKHSYNPSLLFNTKEDGSHDIDCALIAVELLIRYDTNGKTYWEQVKKEVYGLR